MRDHYTIDNLLGTGAYGEVRRCIYKKDVHDKKCTTKQFRACKILSKAYMEEKDKAGFEREVECMQVLQHPSIMKMFHFFEDSKRYMVITEMCEGGELLDYMQ